MMETRTDKSAGLVLLFFLYCLCSGALTFVALQSLLTCFKFSRERLHDKATALTSLSVAAAAIFAISF